MNQTQSNPSGKTDEMSQSQIPTEAALANAAGLVDVRVRDANDNAFVIRNISLFDADDQITLIKELQELVQKGQTIIIQPQGGRS